MFLVFEKGFHVAPVGWPWICHIAVTTLNLSSGFYVMDTGITDMLHYTWLLKALFSKEVFLFFFMWLFFLICVYECLHVCSILHECLVSAGSEEGIRFPGTGVTSGCDMSHGCSVIAVCALSHGTNSSHLLFFTPPHPIRLLVLGILAFNSIIEAIAIYMSYKSS